MTAKLKIAFLGFGEAGQAFASGLLDNNHTLEVTAFDIKANGPEADAMRLHYERCGVVGANTLAEACDGADLIFSLVTADHAEIAAKQATKLDLANAIFLDCNSCAPETKCRSAKIIEASRGRYVDVAVMTPVHPRLHKSPCFLAGQNAEAADATLSSLGMSVQVVGDEIGAASTRKMIRSVMIKGLEALTLECFLAARLAGIEEEIVASLETTFPGFDWHKRAPYMIERAVTHGTRRAAEMQEVSKTLLDLGVSPYATDATVMRQSQVGALKLDAEQIGANNLGALTDAVQTALKMKTN